jgi:hypothetical protein
MSIISDTFWFVGGMGNMENMDVGVRIGKGVFMTSAMLGFCLVS